MARVLGCGVPSFPRPVNRASPRASESPRRCGRRHCRLAEILKEEHSPRTRGEGRRHVWPSPCSGQASPPPRLRISSGDRAKTAGAAGQSPARNSRKSWPQNHASGRAPEGQGHEPSRQPASGAPLDQSEKVSGAPGDREKSIRLLTFRKRLLLTEARSINSQCPRRRSSRDDFGSVRHRRVPFRSWIGSPPGTTSIAVRSDKLSTISQKKNFSRRGLRGARLVRSSLSGGRGRR